MIEKSDKDPNSADAAEPEKIRAAEYVRMSTEHQKYSTENQGDAIRIYADLHNMEIVRTYSDAGKEWIEDRGPHWPEAADR